MQVGMTFVHITVAEISPDRLRGYGSLDDDAAATVVNVQQELWRLIDRVSVVRRVRRAIEQAPELARTD